MAPCFQALLRICKDSQLLVDLYLNYDCDLNLDNLFSRMIADVSRIAQGRQSNELGGTPQQEAALKQLVCATLLGQNAAPQCRGLYGAWPS